ncbi:MAG TPA: hypothetical protein PKY10_00420 [Lentisphaeria bacterium]|nr:hypothetical protein [Lentisphaeria bacterium]
MTMSAKKSPQFFLTMSSALLLIGGLAAIWMHAQLRLRLKQERRQVDVATKTARDMLSLLERPGRPHQNSHDAERRHQELLQDAADLRQKAAAIQDLTATDSGNEVKAPLAPGLPELIDRYGWSLEQFPEKPSDAQWQAVVAEQEKIRQALLEVILEGQKRQARFMHASQRHLDIAIWLLAVVMASVLYTTLKSHSRLQEQLVQPLEKITSLLRTALNNPTESVVLPGQENQQLDRLASLCNTILAERLRAEDASRSQLADMRKTADCLIAVFPEPTIVLAGSQEIFLANQEAWKWLANEADKSMRQHLLDAIAAKAEEFESHGQRFTLTTLTPAQGRTSPLLAMYQFRQMKPAETQS